MDEDELGAAGTPRQPLERTREVGMSAGGGQEIGFEADGVENSVGCEAARDLGVEGGGSVDAHQPFTYRGSQIRLGATVAQLALPHPKRRGSRKESTSAPAARSKCRSCGTASGTIAPAVLSHSAS